MTVQNSCFCSLLVSGVFFLHGCFGSSDAFPNSVPVTGTVSIDGKPIATGFVMFVPETEQAGQLATGRVRDGEFVMQTTVSSPGVVMGKYGIQIESYDETQLDKNGAPKNLAPKKYQTAKTSGLTADVMKDMEPLRLELTSR